MAREEGEYDDDGATLVDRHHESLLPKS